MRTEKFSVKMMNKGEQRVDLEELFTRALGVDRKYVG